MEHAPRPVRRSVAALGLAACALVATSCAGGLVGESPAATVNGTDITQADVQRAVDGTRALIELQIDASQALIDQPDPNAPATFTQEDLDARAAEALAPYGDLEGSYPTELASSELTQLIRDELVRQELERLDALPGEAELDAVRAQLSQQVGGEELLGQLDEDVAEFVVAAQARANAFQATTVPDPAEREQQLQDLYDQLAPTLPLCLNLLYVETEAEADAARGRIDGGESFGAVAAEVSLAQATEENQGFAGCIDEATAESTLGTDLADLAAGDLAGPFALDPGDGTQVFAVIQLESADGGTLEQLRPQLEAQLPGVEEAAAQAAAEATAQLLDDADVTVDPRFGTWDESDRVVVPPAVPWVEPELEEGPVLVTEN